MKRIEIELTDNELVFKDARLEFSPAHQMFIVTTKSGEIHMFPVRYVMRASELPTPN